MVDCSALWIRTRSKVACVGDGSVSRLLESDGKSWNRVISQSSADDNTLIGVRCKDRIDVILRNLTKGSFLSDSFQFAGSWDTVAGHQAPLYAPPGAPSVDAAVQFYRSKGLHPSKLVIGELI